MKNKNTPMEDTLLSGERKDAIEKHLTKYLRNTTITIATIFLASLISFCSYIKTAAIGEAAKAAKTHIDTNNELWSAARNNLERSLDPALSLAKKVGRVEHDMKTIEEILQKNEEIRSAIKTWTKLKKVVSDSETKIADLVINDAFIESVARKLTTKLPLKWKEAKLNKAVVKGSVNFAQYRSLVFVHGEIRHKESHDIEENCPNKIGENVICSGLPKGVSPLQIPCYSSHRPSNDHAPRVSMDRIILDNGTLKGTNTLGGIVIFNFHYEEKQSGG